jgi:hypothetical protein
LPSASDKRNNIAMTHALVLLIRVSLRWRWVSSTGGLKLTGENWSTWRKTCLSATFRRSLLNALCGDHGHLSVRLWLSISDETVCCTYWNLVQAVFMKSCWPSVSFATIAILRVVL